MRRRVAFPLAVFAVVVSGAAFGVSSSPTAALDTLSQRKDIPRAASPSRALTPTEVEIALKELTAEKQSLLAEATELTANLASTEARLNARGRAYYKQVRAGLVPAGGGFDELVDHAVRVERTHVSLTRDLEKAKSIRKRLADVELRVHALDREVGPLEAQKKAWDKAKSYLRQADERKAAFDRAFGTSSSAPSDAVTIYGREVSSDDVAPTGNFAAMKGRLALPIAGRTEVRVIEGSGGPGTALELHASSSSTARSVARGRVVFVDRDEWDRLSVIIDHGDRFFTVYTNLVQSEVRVGETIDAGIALGPVAQANGATVLTFELRQEGRAVIASPWFGL